MKKYITLALILLISITIILTSSVYAYSPDVVNAMPLPNFDILNTYEVTAPSSYPIILDYTREYVTSYKVVEVILNQDLNDGYPVTWYSLTSAQAPTSPVITFVSFANEPNDHSDAYNGIGNKYYINDILGYNVLQYQNTPDVLGGNKNYITLQFTQNSTAIFVFRSSANIATQSALLKTWLNSGRFYNGSYNDFYATYINNVTSNLDQQYNNGYTDGFSAGQNTLADQITQAYSEAYEDAKNFWAYKKNDSYYKGSVAYDMGYEDGLSSTSWFESILSAMFGVFNILTIPILGDITIGHIVAVPLVLGLLAFVLGIAQGKKGGK